MNNPPYQQSLSLPQRILVDKLKSTLLYLQISIVEKNALLANCIKKSITYDRGKEMSMHELLTSQTGIKVYFADPHAP